MNLRTLLVITNHAIGYRYYTIQFHATLYTLPPRQKHEHQMYIRLELTKNRPLFLIDRLWNDCCNNGKPHDMDRLSTLLVLCAGNLLSNSWSYYNETALYLHYIYSTWFKIGSTGGASITIPHLVMYISLCWGFSYRACSAITSIYMANTVHICTRAV